MIWRFFFYNSYLNNHNFNNKSDKIEILRIYMVARHCQWRCVNVSCVCAKMLLRMISLCFIFFRKKFELFVGLNVSGKNITLNGKKN
jgi:hypothetical protein